MSAVVTGPFYVIDVFCSNNTVRVHFFQALLMFLAVSIFNLTA